jgi:protein-L-isoaspartate(D-aspartate) O-methyltransferase
LNTLSRRALLGATLLPAAALAQTPPVAPQVEAPAAPTPPTPPAAPAVRSTMVIPPPWTRDRYLAAMAASHRRVPDISAARFTEIQARRERGLRRIENYLRERFRQADPRVLAAFAEVPREFFHYDYQYGGPAPSEAWEDPAKPWGIGYGSALSDYLGQAYMTQVAAVQPDFTTLEIGTGSGFQTAILSRMVRKAYSIEIIEPLGRQVAPLYPALGYDNVQTRVGDGFFGWPEVEGGFDMIIVTCAAQYAPPALFQQLKPGGKLVIPIGQPFRRGQFLYIYTKDAAGKVTSRKDVGVFFIPMTGTMMKGAGGA